MHCQFLEIIRILIDSYGGTSGSQRDAIVDIFYEKHLPLLLDVIASSCPPQNSSCSITNRPGSITATKPEILANICELLCFCVIHHPCRIRGGFLVNNAIEKVLCLTRRREKFLVVSAVRFMRTIVSCNDEHLLRHIARNNILRPVIEAFIENGDRYNMLHSGVLELLEYIRRENVKVLVLHIVDSFWDKLMKFRHLGTIQSLKIKQEQLLENPETKNAATSIEPRSQTEQRALEKEEEDYFNEDSDEEDSAAGFSQSRNQHARAKMPNGIKDHSSFRPGSVGLVDYDDDDEDYNPPPKKSDTSTEDDVTFSKIKRRSANLHENKDRKSEPTKKQKLDIRVNDGKAAVSSASASCSDNNAQSGSNEVDKLAVKVSSKSVVINHLAEAPETRQSSGEDSPSIPPNSSLSKGVPNG
ncbi:serine/threonine-protein phosphatase 4 regulatory subunit 3B-like [Zingiber officinale]|uniref:serine/threonine-protein phosphatase 4 regulatory subunit 3B-like n=1 Tax=Zingiber officinale TaxID=94328 RepID=UPI001C4ACAE6|nr:serine/threonine-protein phosphatase 4 regulatory subunit 3B-like [Zingiber officinale]